MKKAFFYIALSFFVQFGHAQAGFKADINKGCGPLTVQFTDLTPKGMKWTWDLGNGNSSSKPNPSAIYTNPGTYTISLTVVDSSFNKFTVVKTGWIKVYSNPLAACSTSTRKICPGDSLTFFDQSVAGDTTINKWSWDFGDGYTTNTRNPVHSYSVPGYKNISLAVVDKNGCSNQLQSNGLIRVVSPPIADFIQDTSFNCTKTQKVNFTNASSPTGLTYLWKFGDGGTSTATDPSHTYLNYGNYNVSLFVQDKNTGCYITKSVVNAVVLDKLIVDFDVLSKTVCDVSTSARFYNKVIAYQGYTATWDYGDGSKSAAWEEFHQYKNYGTYDVQLIVKGPNCKASKTKTSIVNVVQNPVLKIRANDTGACGNPFTMKLIASATGTSTIQWDFGDKSTGSGNTVSHLYSKFDSFFVTAIATAKNTCRDTQKMWIRRNELIVYTKGMLGGCVPFKSNVNMAIYSNTAPINKVEWFYQNKRIDSGAVLKYLFKDTGNYKIKLKVSNSKGCVDSPVVNIGAGIRIKANFTEDKNRLCLRDSIHFTNTTKNFSPKAHSYQWISSEGGIAYTKNYATQFYTSQGPVTIKLIVNHFGCADTMVKSDSVFVMSPLVSFKVSSVGCVLPAKLSVLNTTTIPFTKFKWYTIPKELSKNNDSLILDLQKYQRYELHIFAENDTNGCADSGKYDLKFFNNNPKAKAKYKIVEPCPPALVTFTDTGTKGSNQYWKLPDGSTSTLMALDFPIPDYGTYICKRMAINEFQFQTCKDSVVFKVVIPKPDTRFSITPAKGCTPVQSQFVDSGYGANRKASWKFGDTSLKSTAGSQKFTFNYTFDSLKTPVFFTAFDSLGRCSETSKSMVEISGPKAKINSSAFYTCKITTLKLSFTPLSKRIKSWRWLADDTFITTNANADFVVYTARYVNAQLQITDSSGCTSTITNRILVRVFRPEVIIASDTSGASCPPLVVKFKDKSTSYNNPVETWLWDFGDGSTSSLQNPAHTFIATGDYNITLKVKNFVGCFSTKVFKAYIRIKGPQGSIITNVDSGCTPLSVKFSSSDVNLANIRWDYGDGFESMGVTSKHAYKTAGKYRPSAIFEDSTGCKIGVQYDALIKTNQSAVARIKQLNFCDNDMLFFADSSNYYGAPATNLWRHEQAINSGKNFNFKSTTAMQDSLHFIAYGNYGCNDTLNLVPRKSRINVLINSTKDTACVGDSILFTDKSNSDTNIVSKKWLWQGYTSGNSVFKTVAVKAGLFSVFIKLKNAFGCADSALFTNRIYVGDSAKPSAPWLRYVTVTGDNTQQLTINEFQSSDWRRYTLFHTTPIPEKLLAKHYQQTDTIFNTSSINSLLASQCFRVSNMNICSKESDPTASVVHCTINLLAKGDTNKVELNWNTYIGDKPVKHFVYRKLLSAANFVKIDSLSGDSFHYIDYSVACTNKYAYQVSALLLRANKVSESDTAQAEPIYKNRLNKPFITLVTVEQDKSLKIEFDSLVKSNPTVSFYNLEKSDDGTVFTVDKKFAYNGPFYYADQKVKTDEQNYFYRISATDLCNGQGPVSETSGSILLSAKSTQQTGVVLSWNSYKYWPGGVNHYEIQQMGDNGMYGTILQTKDTFLLLQSPGSACGAQPFFRVIAVSNNNVPFIDNLPKTSYSNTISLSDKPEVLIPTAFTPNGDALNQSFKPNCYWIKSYEMMIYNRWGALLYTADGCNAEWNGNYQGKKVDDGVYVYRMTVTAFNGRKFYYQGTVTLMR